MELELQQARDRLVHAQREAQLAKVRREAEELRKKSIQKKQADRDNKKAEAEQARYEKSTNKINRPRAKAVQVQVAHPENPSDNNNDENEDDLVSRTKKKVKMLNPLRRARKNYTGADGSNNPNVPGQDNGTNAWLDAQLNGEHLDEDIRVSTRYAKRNSDRNRCYDIDDVPIRGPRGPPNSTNEDDIKSVISVSEATYIANQLLDDDELYICRNSGMLRRKDDQKQELERDQRRRQPTSTITRPGQMSGEINDSYNSDRGRRRKDKSRERWQDDYYRYNCNEQQGWDTASESDLDVYHETVLKKKKSKSKSNTKSHNDEYDLDRVEKYDASQDRPYRNDHYRRERTENMPYRSRSRDDADNRQGSQSRKHRDNNRSRDNRGRYHRNEVHSSDSDNTHSSRRIKSGINAKPNSEVSEQKRYPQFSLGQVSGFVGQDIRFEHLTYEQFLAGELTTIINCTDPIEARGRTEILERHTLWRMRINVTWPQVRGTYSYILRKIENQEITWQTDWDKFERHIYEKVSIPNSGNTSTPMAMWRNRTNNPEVVWFCKAYQKPEGCNRESPHASRIGTQYKQVHHICALCWLRDKVKRNHSESSQECPNKEA